MLRSLNFGIATTYEVYCLLYSKDQEWNEKKKTSQKILLYTSTCFSVSIKNLRQEHPMFVK